MRRYFRGLPADAVVLFEDETDLLLFPPLRLAWARRGKQATVRISGYNARRVVSVVLNIHTGRRISIVRQRQRSVEFQELLHQIRSHYRGRSIALFLDEDSSHTAHASQDCAANLDIELCWLPLRSPELNPLESLWRITKANRCANRQYTSIDAQVEAFLAELNGMSNLDALSRSGLLSGNFWLF